MAVDTSSISSALDRDDYETVISEVKAAVTDDAVGALSDPVVSSWLKRRFTNIFLSEAEVDPDALKVSEKPIVLRRFDRRDARERVAQRMFKDITAEEIHTEMPAAETETLSNTTLVFAPGLLTGLLPVLAFQSVWPQVTNRFGLRVIASDSHPMRSARDNVSDLENAIERGIGVAGDPEGSFITDEDDPEPIDGDFLLIGYSKGAPDVLNLLIRRPDLAPRIRGVVGWAGAIGGSYLANDIYEKLTKHEVVANSGNLTKEVTESVMRLAPIAQLNKINRRIEEYDVIGALKSLTTHERDRFIGDHEHDLAELRIPMMSFTGATSVLDVPYFQWQGTLQLNQYDVNNDMQLTQEQAQFPSTLGPHLAMFNANHWDLSYDSFPWYTTMGSRKLKDPFARRAAMFSIVLLMSEIGLLD